MNEGRDVAVKVMRLDELDEWKSFELFEREANILANLEHDGIPDFYEVFQGKDDEGRDAFCLVQEYIEGETLGECIDRGRRFEADEIQRLALGLIDILEYLHKLSPPVFHRDIKPSNILLRADLTPVIRVELRSKRAKSTIEKAMEFRKVESANQLTLLSTQGTHGSPRSYGDTRQTQARSS